ncbi:Scramblase-domain-containing protein [Panus rudis PR-1116 ss-1]|nr:Scramblase-domain-containing protein [Panus rudis PR-1116 ss-1]
MLARQLGCLPRTACTPSICPQLIRPVANQFRTYALSRFENKRIGRTRPELQPRTRKSSYPEIDGKLFDHAERVSTSDHEDSPLWEASQRPPASNPEEGLKTLLMDNEVLIVERQIEMLNIFVGFEQANRYIITNEQDQTLGYIAEEPRGFLSMFSRQMFRTHRPFRAVVMDQAGSPILWLRRPFSWINSRMFVQRLQDYGTYTPEGEPVLDTFAEVQQRWHLWRRRYDLFLRKQETQRILSLASDPQPEPEIEGETFYQFAEIDEGLWAWDFSLKDGRGEEIASVNRSWGGLGREIFTDTGRYYIRFTPQPRLDIDSPNPGPVAPVVIRNLTLEERALVLAMAVNVDFDYFSRHSHGHGVGFLHMGSWGDWSE